MTDYIQQLATRFKQEGKMFKLCMKSAQAHMNQLCELNEEIVKECKKEGISIESLKLSE